MRLGADEVKLVRTLLDVAPVLMYADQRPRGDDEPGRFLPTPNTQRLVGGTPTGVGELYERLATRVHDEDRLELASAKDAALSGRATVSEVRLRADDGAYRWWRISTESRDGGGLLLGFLWDISESVEAAASAHEARLEAEWSRDRAVAANSAKTEFLSRMSHELRTPLNSIVGFGQLLEMQTLASNEQEWVGHVVRAGRHLLALIDDVLDVAGIESGTFEVSLEPTSVVEAIDEAIGLMQPSAAEHGVSMHWLAPPDALWAVGDHQRLLQIMLSLLDNAVVYNRRGGALTVTAASYGSQVEVVVSDTGPGVSPGLLSRAFDPFDRLGVERLGIEGTGMGLTLARSLAERMQGSLAMASTEGVGSSLRLLLAVAPPPTLPDPSSTPVVVAEDRAHEEPFTVLYIEDNMANLRLMESVMDLRPAVTLVTAMRGRLGFEIARDQRPDLVLVDLHLPDIDGRQVLRLLRNDAITASLPVAVVSADATEARIDELRSLGADYYLTKPIDIHDLIGTVDHLVEAKRRERGGSG